MLIVLVTIRSVDNEELTEQEVGKSVANNYANNRVNHDDEEIIEATNVTKERHTVIGNTFLLGCSRLKPHLDCEHGLLRIDIFLRVAVPVLPRHDILVLYPSLWIGQQLGIRQ